MTEPLNFTLPNPDLVKATVIMDLDFYSEGPVVDKEGHLFFTDLAGHSIWQLKNNIANVWAKGVRPNGQVILKDESHLICDSSAGWVAHYNHKGDLIAKLGLGLIENVNVQCPSDITSNQYGFYFTDSVRHHGAVFYIGFDGTRKVIATDLDYPNGIALSPDGKQLFVAESYTNKILKIGLEDSNESQRKIETFATLPFNTNKGETNNLPDGIAFDPIGRLWVAHYGMEAVQVLSKTGNLLATYNTGIPLTSNLCFSGTDIIVTGGLKEPGPGRLSKLTIFKKH